MTQDYTGRVRFLTDHTEGIHSLIVAVPCLIGSSAEYTRCLIDTGSEWCVLAAPIAELLGLGASPGSIGLPLHTRFGTVYGRLERLSIRFPAWDGEDLELEATFFISDEWPGPTVLGWRGCFERLRFGLDPGDDSFYFAVL